MRKLTAYLHVTALLLTSAVALSACSITESLTQDMSVTTYTEFVESVLECSYTGESETYISLCECTQDDVDEVYQGEIDYLVYCLTYFADCDTDYMSDSDTAMYEEMAKTILSKLKYEVAEAVYYEDDGIYTVTVTVYPIDFWDIAYDDLYAYYEDTFPQDEYATAVDEDDTDTVTQLEQMIISDVYEIMSGYVEQIGYGDAQTYTVTIEESDGTYGVADDDWWTIDDMLLGLYTTDDDE